MLVTTINHCNSTTTSIIVLNSKNYPTENLKVNQITLLNCRKWEHVLEFVLDTTGSKRVKTAIMIKYSAPMKKSFIFKLNLSQKAEKREKFHFQKLFDDQENYKCYMKKRYKIVNTVIQIIKILCLEREKRTHNA